MATYNFDLFVIGGGSGGVATARRAAEYGAKVGLAEVSRLGGTCVNRGCIPKKLMVYASRFPHYFETATGYGWSPVQNSLDWQKLLTAVNSEVERLNGIYQRLLNNSGVQVFPAAAKLIDSHRLTVGEATVTAEKILIAVGGHPVKPDIPGQEYAVISDAMFMLPQQPQRLIILGGGYIGVEFACIMNALGTEVTQIIRRDKILKGFDEDIQSAVQEAMVGHGIRLLTNSNLTAIEKTTEGLKIRLHGGEIAEIDSDGIVLAATGRKPIIENLGLDSAGVVVKNGAIAVDEYSRTSQPNIYAVGDCTDRINLTPVAINEGRAFADTEFGNKPRLMSHENVPSAVFSTPEAATVGLTEAVAKAKYGETGIKIYRSQFRPLFHTLTGQAEKTLMKLVVKVDTDQVVGAHMVGEGAAEIIQGVAIAVKMGAKKADFDGTVGIHPTAAEEFVTMR